MHDVFLADALDGFASVEGAHAEAIERLQQRIDHKAQPPHTAYRWYAAAAVLVLLLAVSGYLLTIQQPEYRNVTDAAEAILPEHNSEQPATTQYAVTRTEAVEETSESTPTDTPQAMPASQPPLPVRHTATAEQYAPAAVAPQATITLQETSRSAEKAVANSEELSISEEPAEDANPQDAKTAAIATTGQLSGNSITTNNMVIKEQKIKIELEPKHRVLERIGDVPNTAPIFPSSAGLANDAIVMAYGIRQPAVKTADSAPAGTSRVAGYVVDGNGKPVSGAVIINDNNTLAVADHNGRFEWQAASNAVAQVTMAGCETVTIIASERLQVVVVPCGTMSAVRQHPPEKTFRRYVRNHLQQQDGCRGEVELAFTAGDNGIATGITVSRSLCAEADIEAIRLVMTWNRWRSGKQNITIKFGT
jgi:hypothetical protein